MEDRSVLFWFRRDLRLTDNRGLFEALNSGHPVIPVFIFDTTILKSLPPHDKRVSFIYGCLKHLKQSLREVGKDLIIEIGDPSTLIPKLAQTHQTCAVYTNDDYEPQAKARDALVADTLRSAGISFHAFTDQCIFSGEQLRTQQGKPYTVFTPYKKAWLKALTPMHYAEYPSQRQLSNLLSLPTQTMPPLNDIGFDEVDLKKLNPTEAGAHERLAIFLEKIALYYDQTRELPSIAGSSFLSVYLRFGCISIRHLIRCIQALSVTHPENLGLQTWQGELIWRDFYFQILFNFPHASTHTFKPDYQSIQWHHNPAWLAAWKNAQTGFPIIDAAMTQLNQTGYMHNRMRMLVASFLTKDLLIDYREGEAYFAEKLMDFDLSANNGGWQWAASTGCDAQPYFRIFNPSRQSLTYDKDAKYIKKYLPCLQAVPSIYLHEPWKYASDIARYGVTLGKDYPHAMVDHDKQRHLALRMFELAKITQSG